MKIQRIIFLPVVLCGFTTWSLTFREEDGLRVFEIRVLREIFGPKGTKFQGSGEAYITRRFVLNTAL